MLKRLALAAIAAASLCVLVLLVLWLRDTFAGQEETTLTEQADTLIEQGERDSAIELLDRAVAESPGNLEAGLTRARLTANEDPEAARAQVQAALDAEDPTPEQLDEAAALAIRLGMAETAVQLALKLREIAPNSIEVYRLVGRLALIAGELQLAEQMFSQVILNNPDDQMSQNFLGQTLGRSSSLIDRTRAKGYLMEIARSTPPNGDTLTALMALATLPNLPLSEAEERFVLNDLWAHPQFAESGIMDQSQVLFELIGVFQDAFPERAFHLSQQLVKLPAASDEDRIRNVFLGQVVDRHQAVAADLEALGARAAELEAQQQLQVNVLQANQALLEGRHEDGVERLEATLATSPENIPALQIIELALRTDAYTLPQPIRDGLIALTLDHPQASVDFKLQGLAERIEAQPARRQEILQEAIQRFAEGEPLRLAVWLVRQEEYLRVLDVIPEEAALDEVDLLKVRLSSLLALQRHTDAAQLLQAGRELMTPLDFAFFGTTLAYQREDNAVLPELWDAAFERAREARNAIMLLQLGRLSADRGLNERSVQSSRLARRLGAPFSEQDLQRFFALLLDAERYREALDVTVELEDRFTTNPAHINNTAYLSLLLGERLEASTEALIELVDDYPQRREFRVSLALGYLLNERAERALRLLEETPIEFTPENASSLAVYAAVLAANGREGQARGYLPIILDGELLLLERQLIEPLLEASAATP